jgi:hypothetical protein
VATERFWAGNDLRLVANSEGLTYGRREVIRDSLGWPVGEGR